jgi:hypothetical protein
MDDKLRPLTLGEILDRTTRLYRHNFWTFAGVAAVPMVAMFGVGVPFGAAMGFMGVFKTGQTTITGAVIGLIALAVLIGLPVLLVASVVSQASLTKTAIGTHMGQKIKVREAIKSVWPRFWNYLGLIVMLALLVVMVPSVVIFLSVAGYGALSILVRGGAAFFMALVILIVTAALVYMVWRWLCYCMAMSACIVEEKNAWQSIRRANLLSKGTRGRIFVMYLLVMAIAFVIAMIADILMLIVIAILTALGGSKFGPVATVVGLILGFLARVIMQILIQPVPVIALVLFYFDQRVRKEGYDIELMMEQAGLTSQAETARPAEPGLPAAPEFRPVPGSPLTPYFEPGAGTDNLKEQ